MFNKFLYYVAYLRNIVIWLSLDRWKTCTLVPRSSESALSEGTHRSPGATEPRWVKDMHRPVCSSQCWLADDIHRTSQHLASLARHLPLWWANTQQRNEGEWEAEWFMWCGKRQSWRIKCSDRLMWVACLPPRARVMFNPCFSPGPCQGLCPYYSQPLWWYP